MYDMIVIGGGPAALSAAFYAQGKGVDVVMLFEELGGKVGWLQSLAGSGHEPYLPGNEMVQILTSRIMTQPDRVIHDRALKVSKEHTIFRVETQAHGVLEAPIVIMATGTRPVPLDVPGAERLVERGLDYSAATYAHTVAGQPVAVIGGTVRALAGAAELATIARRVYLIPSQTPRHDSALGIVLRQHPKVEVLDAYDVVEVCGDDAVKELLITHAGQLRQLHVSHVFVSLGVEPNSAIVRELVETDHKGFIVVDENHETSEPGLFAAGDVTTRFGEQVLVAIGEGAWAAISAYHHLLARRLATRRDPAAPSSA